MVVRREQLGILTEIKKINPNLSRKDIERLLGKGKRAKPKRIIRRKARPKAIMPTSIRELQYTPNIKRFLTPAERREVEAGLPGQMRFNAVQILRKKMEEKEKNAVKERVDSFSGRRTVGKRPAVKENWLQ